MSAMWAYNHSMNSLGYGDVALVNTQSRVISRPLDGRPCPRKCCPAVAVHDIPRDSWGIVVLRGNYYTMMSSPEALDDFDAEAVRRLVSSPNAKV